MKKGETQQFLAENPAPPGHAQKVQEEECPDPFFAKYVKALTFRSQEIPRIKHVFSI